MGKREDAAAAMAACIEAKFFPRDVLTGTASAVGDRFTAQFMGAPRTFEVTEHYGAFFMAEAVA